MRILKAVGVLLAMAMAVGWFVAMAHIGIENQDEWYGHMDKDNGVVEQDNTTDVPLPPCEDDSAPNYPCQWDATTQGDGEGRSFWVDEYGDTHYWEDA